MAVKASQVQEWLTLLQAAAPAVSNVVGLTVSGVIALIRLVRRARGEQEEQPGDVLLAEAIIAAWDKSKTPFIDIIAVAEQELAQLAQRRVASAPSLDDAETLSLESMRSLKLATRAFGLYGQKRDAVRALGIGGDESNEQSDGLLTDARALEMLGAEPDRLIRHCDAVIARIGGWRPPDSIPPAE